MDGRRTTKRQYSEYSNFFVTQREPEYDQDTDLHQRESTQISTPRTTGRGGHMKIASIQTQSVSGQNSRRATNAEWGVDLLVIEYLKRRIDTETAGGISHGSGPCLRLTEQIVRHWRAP